MQILGDVKRGIDPQARKDAERAAPTISAPNVTEGMSGKEKPLMERSMSRKCKKGENAPNPIAAWFGISISDFCNAYFGL